jgi:heme exporter protein C
MAVTVWLGLWVTPPSVNMGQLVRLVYIHPPVAWVALYLAFGALGLGSVLWLWPRTRNLAWDRLAAAGAEVGVIFTALTLATGSIWGRPTWGVWWAWDARLTSTALLLVLLLGYLALRRVPADPDTRARRSAVAGLVALVDVPIVYFSVSWWHTLHENTQVDIHGLMAATMLLGFVAFTLMFVWMLATALRIQTLRAHLEDLAMDQALAERQAEGALVAAARPMGEPTLAPAGSLPSVSMAVGSMAPGSVPSGSMASGSVPSGSMASGSVAPGSVASGSVAPGSVPSGSLLASPVDAAWPSTGMSVLHHGPGDGPGGVRGGAR